ncbi:MAG TPA: hypothetical protein VHW23_14155, partial [Kofleriaceae bacterium]|nr:hypothetical protein [Kofleriaceae bacterium]
SLLAVGACNDRRASRQSVAASPIAGPGSAAPVPAAAPIPGTADAVIQRAFDRANDTFAVSDLTLEYVRQDGTLDPTYGHAQIQFGHRPHPPPPPADDPRRPIGAPVPPPAAVQESLFDHQDDCPRVTWEPGHFESVAGGSSCGQLIPPIRGPLGHPHCGVREIWKRAIAKGAPAEALARLALETDMLADDHTRPVWKFTIEDAPRGIHIEETIADDCEPVVEKPSR